MMPVPTIVHSFCRVGCPVDDADCGPCLPDFLDVRDTCYGRIDPVVKRR